MDKHITYTITNKDNYNRLDVTIYIDGVESMELKKASLYTLDVVLLVSEAVYKYARSEGRVEGKIKGYNEVLDLIDQLEKGESK